MLEATPGAPAALRSADEQPRLREAGLDLSVGLEQVGQALPLLQASQEEHVELAVLELGEGRQGGGEPLVVDTVGDDFVVVLEIALYQAERSRGDSDLALNARPPVRDGRPEIGVPLPALVLGGVKGGHGQSLRAAEHLEG